MENNMPLNTEIQEVLDGKRDWAVICGDCIEIMREMPDGCVDHVITDPPYSDTTHDGARKSISEKLITFSSISEKLMVEISKEFLRVAKRWAVFTCEWRFMSALETTGNLVRFGIWNKPTYTPQFTGDRPATGWEAIAIMHKPGKKEWNGGGHRGVWTHNKIAGEHPTQKPIPLIMDFVNDFTNPGDIIFDPFAGSGTTGVTALRLNRKFIGIEIEEKYCAIAKRRIMSETANLPM